MTLEEAAFATKSSSEQVKAALMPVITAYKSGDTAAAVDLFLLVQNPQAVAQGLAAFFSRHPIEQTDLARSG